MGCDMVDFEAPISGIQKSLSVFSKKPIVLLPALAGSIVSTLLSFIDGVSFFGWVWFANISFYSTNQILLGIVVSLIQVSLTLFLIFVSLDMIRDAHLKVEPNIKKSISYVRSRIITIVLAVVIGQAMVITIVLIPLAIGMLVILVVDDTNVGTALSRALEFVRKRPIDLIALAAIALAARVIMGPVLDLVVSIPFIGLLTLVTDLMVAFAVMDIYSSYKQPPN